MQKKEVSFDQDKPKKSSSMLVGEDAEGTDFEGEEDVDTEGELYKLIRGNTSLMIAATSDDSDDESEENDICKRRRKKLREFEGDNRFGIFIFFRGST